MNKTSEKMLAAISCHRLLRYWLKGSNAGKVELFALSPGHPDNVRRNEKGEFWVAMHCKRSKFIEWMSPYPWIRTLMARLPIPLRYIYSLMLAARPHAMVARFSEDGELLQVLEDSEGKVVRTVSEAEERDGTLWISSVVFPQIALFPLES
jgi:sugar lactone lactonase YvrE